MKIVPRIVSTNGGLYVDSRLKTSIRQKGQALSVIRGSHSPRQFGSLVNQFEIVSKGHSLLFSYPWYYKEKLP
jgi:hypothetical protein